MSDGRSRREFLGGVGGCFAAALAFGLSGVDLHALPVVTIAGRPTRSGRAYPIPGDDSVNIDYKESAILVRQEGQVFAFSLACPHQNAAVKWLAADRRFQCTKHDSRYQPTGEYTSGRATRNMDRFAISRDGSSVIVDFDRVYRSDEDPAGWAAAVVAVG